MSKVVTFGEIMMRLSTPNHARFSQSQLLQIIYGGGEANMSVGLAQLGIAAKHVTCFPNNDIGKAASSFFTQFGVEMHAVFEGDRLGLYFLETGAGSRSSKIVYDRFHSAFSKLNPAHFNWNALLKDAEYFLFTGITPAISQSAADACLEAVKTAHAKGITVVGDINYRRNLWQYGKTVQEVLPQFMPYISIAICSENDAADILGIDVPISSSSFATMASKIQLQYPNIKTVISARRKSISASHNTLKGIAFSNGEYIEANEINITDIVDRIGSGDAFAAGFVYGMISKNNVSYAINFATAAAAVKHTIEGDANLASLTEIETVIKGDVSGKLLR
jgi:2-dehydro-3-deoxygluconokinase